MIMEVLNIIIPISYFILTILYTANFFIERIHLRNFLTSALVTILLIHLGYLVLRVITFHHFLASSPPELFTLIAFSLALIYIWIEVVLSTNTTGMFVLGLVAAFQILSSLLITDNPSVNPILRSPLFSVHTGSAILGYSGIALSAMYAILYLMLFYDIKSSRFSIIYNQLPSLETLELMHMRAASVGFTFLTATILLGIVWLQIAFDQIYVTDPKILIALFTWIIFGIVISSKRYFGWSGKRTAYFSLTGFITIVVSMTIVNYFFTSFHRFQ